jgi:cephalosporin hydroxylase
MPFAIKALEYFTNHLKDYDGNYLEIGVFNGDSIASLGDLYPNKKIYGVDPFIEDGNTSHATGKNFGEIIVNQKESTLNLIKDKSNIVLFEMTSKSFFEELNDKKIKELNINAIFIDGDHHYEHVKNDVELTQALIGNKKGLVIFDDTRLEDVQKAMNDFEQALGSRIINKEYIDCCYMIYTMKEIDETT